MDPLFVSLIIGGYFVLLMAISWFTSKNSTAHSFYDGNRQSPWFLVAFGMVGASLSGVTFISVPGEVGNSNFYYFQMVLGYLVGYAIIAQILLPLYYKHNIISIYTYLDQRLGFWSYKSGAFFFLLSRVIGASFRLFLVASVLQLAIFDSYKLPFWVAVVSAVLLIWLYTFRGGIKTIVWTDTLQTTFMLISVLVSIYFIKENLNWSWSTLTSHVYKDSKSTIFNWDWQHNRNFFKQFFSGAFIAVVMTGLDQDMMQKNLSCRSLKDAQKNMFWFSIVLVLVNLLFLGLGALLYIHADHFNIQASGDDLFAAVAMHESMPVVVGLFFLLGLIAAAYSSADSALTSLTTSFCIDILGIENKPITQQIRIRKQSHLFFSAVLFIVILVFKWINDESVVAALFKVAGYTYGPLLGMYAFGLLTPWRIRDKWILPVVLSSPIICYYLQLKAPVWWGFEFGFELLVVNGLLCFLGMVFIRQK